jgi:capsular polysaccharide biosynthesis protein
MSDPQPPYLKLMLRWLLVASLVFGAIAFSGFYITNDLLPKTYTSSAEMLVKPQNDYSKFDPTNFQSEFDIIQSPEVLLPVIHELGLQKAWAVRIFKTEHDLPDQDALAYMHRLVKLDYVRETKIIIVTASSDVPQEAADMANGIVDKYKRMRDIGEDRRINFAVDELNKEIDQQQQLIDQKKGDVVQAETSIQALSDRIKKLQEDHDLAESPVQVLTRAPVPSEPSAPNKIVAFIITMAIGVIMAVALASFAEVALMLTRASERT